MTPNDPATRSSPASRHTTGRPLIRGLALAAALSLGGVAAYAAAGPSNPVTTPGMAWFHQLHGHTALHDHLDDVLTKAGATTAQRQAVDGIVADAMRAQHADFARYHAGLGQLKALLAAPRIDEAAIERVRSEQDEVLLDTDRRLTDTLLRIARILTPEQRRAVSTQIDAMMANPLGHHPSGH